MKEHDKDNLSRFFHKAAQDPEIPFNEKDWEKMEAMLDAQPKGITASGSKKIFSLSVLAFVLIVSLLFVVPLVEKNELNTNVPNKEKSGSAPLKNREPIQNSPDRTLTTTTSRIKSGSAVVIEKEFATGVTQRQLPQSTTDKNLHHATLSFSASLSTLLPGFTDTENLGRINSKQGNIIDTTTGKEQDPIAPFSSSSPLDNIITVDKNPEDINGIKLTRDNISAIGVEQKEVEDRSALQTGRPTDSSEVKIENQRFSSTNNALASPILRDSILAPKTDTLAKIKLETQFLSDSVTKYAGSRMSSRWSFLASVSPDFSTIGLRKLTPPGQAIGLIAFYKLNNSFAVSFGVIGSQKKYNESGSIYSFNYNYWGKKTNGIVPNEVQGNCDVLEIPIGIQYSILSKSKHHLYLAAGFSSYIMLNESYQYVFTIDNPGAEQGWAAKKVNSTAFNVANFSIGYERKISQTMSLGVAPYINVPLSKVGSWADIRLYSLGAAVTLRYKFQKRTRPIRQIRAPSSD